MRHSFFKGKLVRLRAIEPEDLEILYSLENDPEFWDISNFTAPYSKYQLKQYISHNQADLYADQQLRLAITRLDDNELIGTIDVFDLAFRHGRGEIGIAIRQPYQGKGYAKEALTLLCDYLFGFLTLKQLTAHVAADNAVSLHLFRSCGFVECGLLKQWWRINDTYKDVVLLQCIRNK